MVAVYNADTDTYETPHTEPNDEPKRRKRRTKEEMAAARERGEVADKAPSGRGRTSLKAVIKDLVLTANAAIYTLPWTHEDALTEDEAELLIDGIDKAQQVSPTLKRFLQTGSRLSGWGSLIYATTVIALPRLARHGLIPIPAPKESVQEQPIEQPITGTNGYSPDFSPSVVTG